MEVPFLVLGDVVQDYSFVEDNRAFRKVNCQRKEAYCVPNGDDIVKGLKLYVRLGRDDDPAKRPELCLRATDEVFRLIGLQLDVDKAERYGSQTRLSSRICTVDGDVMVIRISFIPSFTGTDLSYYLVYDSAAASLFLLPCRPTSCRWIYTKFPLKVKAGAEDKYSLVLMAERSVCTPAKYTDPVLCLWSPPDDNRQQRDGHSNGAWVVKDRLPSNAVWANPFEAHVVFSCKGNAVWGDLAQGIMYCGCSDLIDGPDPVEFKHIMLPEECRTAYSKYDWDQESIDVYRNMGCVGDSIWFVIIHPSLTCPGDARVKVWTLDLLSEDEEWSLHRVFNMQSVWKLEQAIGLPGNVAQYPFLRQQDHCGIYMYLREPYNGGGQTYAHLVCIDLSKKYKVRLRLRKRLAMPRMQFAVVLHHNFFGPPGKSV